MRNQSPNRKPRNDYVDREILALERDGKVVTIFDGDEEDIAERRFEKVVNKDPGHNWKLVVMRCYGGVH
jgi:hypothetical protein